MQQINTASSSILATDQTRAVMIWKLIEYLGLVLFTVIVPRLMGPDLYGRFAILLSFIGLLTVACGLGAMPVLGRFIPEYEGKGEKLKSRTLFTQLFWVRALVGGFVSLAFVFLYPLFQPKTFPLTVAFGAGALFLGVLATSCYQFFYGLNKLSRWLSRESLIRLLLLGLLFIFGGWYSLDRATLALFTSHLAFVLVGLFWTRHYFIAGRSALDFSFLFKHLHFGLVLFGANLLLLAVWRGGEVVISFFSGKSAEVAFFSVSNSIAMALSGLISQLAAMIIPSLTALHISGKQGKMESYLGYSLKYLTIGSFFLLFVTYALGSWAVDAALGERYLPVVANLKVITLALPPIALLRTGISLAIVQKQPGNVFPVAIGALVTFVLAAAALVPRSGSYGASAAVTLSMVSAGIIAYHQFSLAPVLAVARFWRLIIVGFVSLSIITLPLASPVPMGLLAAVFYIILLFWGKVLSTTEIRQIGQALVA